MNQVTKPPIKCIGVTFADLNAGMCKWVLAEDCYCGNPAAKWRAPYCVHHAAVAYTSRRLDCDRSEAGGRLPCPSGALPPVTSGRAGNGIVAHETVFDLPVAPIDWW
jgi:hypothetical protein